MRGPSVETRRSGDLAKAGARIEGYAARFDALSEDLGGFRETIASGAFSRSLNGGKDVLALWDHDSRQPLGRLSAGTLSLREDAQGLWFSIDAPDTTFGRDALVSVGRGDVTGASFGFRTLKDEWSQDENGAPLRRLIDLELLEVTITPFPAYPDTSVARRALPRRELPPRLAAAKRALLIAERWI